MTLSGHDIVVTGVGIVSALGLGADTNRLAIIEGRSAIGPVRHLDTVHRDIPVGEVNISDADLAAMAGLSPGHVSLRCVSLGIIAAREALMTAHLGVSDLTSAAFINGTTVGGMNMTERYFGDMLDGDGEACRRFGYNGCGVTTDLMADALGPFAMRTTSSTACSSAANAILAGARMIRAGLVDRALVGGTEALTRFHLNGFNTLMILDSGQCRPFDVSRRGINLGEGAGYLVIECREAAARRGAHVLARLTGWGNACDAFHQTASSDNGEGAFLAISRALRVAGLTPSDIGYVNTHGTGTPNNDISELAAMHRIFGAKLPPYASTKSLTGHTTSASAGIEAVFCVLGLHGGFMPAGLPVADPVEPDNAPLQRTVSADCTHALCNAFGFGGNNTSLIFSKP